MSHDEDHLVTLIRILPMGAPVSESGTVMKLSSVLAVWFYSEQGRALREKALIEIPDDASIGCVCLPKKCHAEIIAGYVNWKKNFEFKGPKARTVILL